MSAEVVHRLGVFVCVTVALGRLVRSLDTARRERRLRRRLTGVLALPSTPPKRPPAAREALRRWLPVMGLLCAGWVLVEGLVGMLAGAAAGAALWRWRLRQGGSTPSQEYDAADVARQLPLAADLLAACITAGASPVTAARAVGDALGGPVGERLARGAAQARLGGEPAEAWGPLAALPGAAPLARLLERAEESGVPAAVPVARLAVEARAERGRAATERARRAGVMVTVPVGLCFLPAFVAVGVMPVVIGLAGGLLAGGLR
jgi:pilus assembly protein TadC